MVRKMALARGDPSILFERQNHRDGEGNWFSGLFFKTDRWQSHLIIYCAFVWSVQLLSLMKKPAQRQSVLIQGIVVD